MKNTKSLYEQLVSMRKNGCTGSDVRDFCELHDLSLRDAERYLANYFAPDRCKGCEYVVYRPAMPPCTNCVRLCTEDYYKKYEGKHHERILKRK